MDVNVNKPTATGIEIILARSCTHFVCATELCVLFSLPVVVLVARPQDMPNCGIYLPTP